MKVTRSARFVPIILAAGFAVGAGAACHAADVAGTAKLSGDQEVPAVTTTANGTGGIVVKADKSVTGSIKTTGMTGTMAHVHLAEPGKNGPPIITLTKTADDTWSIPAGTTLADEQYKSYKDGNLYVNVHSAAHPGGEIRTQLKP